jgi:uncharacterized protein YaiE (UPF0345 family)
MDMSKARAWAAAIAAFAAFTLLYYEPCGPYPEWQTSAYVLPYPAGSTYSVLQGNCTNATHRGPLKYSYDFSMPVGTTVTAARAGVVAMYARTFATASAERMNQIGSGSGTLTIPSPLMFTSRSTVRS